MKSSSYYRSKLPDLPPITGPYRVSKGRRTVFVLDSHGQPLARCERKTGKQMVELLNEWEKVD